jgi:cytidine deaminase
MKNEALIEMAASLVSPRKTNDTLMGDVGCALVTDQGNVYLGVCIDTSSGMGFCAEHNAIGSMVTEKEFVIEKIVAVWKDENGDVYVIPPCGRCREFMRQVNEANLETEVILDKDKTAKLKELLPYHDWWQKIT